MKYNLILKNANIVTATGILAGDLAVTKGKITKIGQIEGDGEIEKDCSGLFVLPGLIDMHVHFRDPGFTEKEDFETGSRAAAAGGVTSVVDMPNTNPPTLTVKALEEKKRIAAGKSLVNFGFYMGFKVNENGDNLNEIKNAKNIAGVKLFMGSTTGNLVVDDPSSFDFLFRLLFELNKPLIVHAEDEKIMKEKKEKYKDSQDPSVHSLIRSPKAAYEAAKAIIHIWKKYDAKLHLTHVSTADEVAELRKFKNERLTADCTPHHLYLDESAYLEKGNLVKVNPPMRTKADRDSLWQALKDGVIDSIATDHAPHTIKEKKQKYSLAPSGVPGVETMLALLLDSVNYGELNLEEVVKYTALNPAKILGILNKGKIEEGCDADLVIVDMEKEKTVGENEYFSKCGWSPYDGKKLKGWPVTTIVNGNIVFDKGKVTGEIKGRELLFS